jgi:CBS domain-containing protein
MSRWTVADVMTRDAVTVAEDTPFRQIVDTMENNGVNAVPVVDRSNRVIGVVTSADLMTKLEFAGTTEHQRLFETRAHRIARHKAAATDAKGLMTAPAATVLPTTPIATASKIMNGELKRLPVVDDLGRLVGMVTRKDILKVYERSDTDIRTDVTTLLTDFPGVEPDQVRANVDNGRVTLIGQVERRSLIETIVRQVQTIDGVVTVDSELSHVIDDVDPGSDVRRRAPLLPPWVPAKFE